jgi:CubicO group peptidase (beta-lactamase class C family)
MPKDAIFALASMTKPIFSVAAMQLLEEGRLLMNMPVAAYLPELRDRAVAVDDAGTSTEPAMRQPVVQDLLRHTSGWVARGAGGDSALHGRYPAPPVTEPLTAEQYLARLSALPLRYQPGTTFEYGPGFDILGLAIERITGRAMHEYLNERLFRPLGMRDTAFVLPSAQASRQARVLPVDPLTGASQATRNQTTPRPIECGGGCLASTAADYLTFAQMLLNGGTFRSTRVLGPKTVEYMTSDATGPDIDLSRLYLMASMPVYGHGYGLGVAVRRGDGLGGTVGSEGSYLWAGSQGTYFWVDPEEELVVVHMAQTPGEIRGYYRQLMPALVYQALID